MINYMAEDLRPDEMSDAEIETHQRAGEIILILTGDDREARDELLRQIATIVSQKRADELNRQFRPSYYDDE